MDVLKIRIEVETTPDLTLTLVEARKLLRASLDAAIAAEGVIALSTFPYDGSVRLAELRALRRGCGAPSVRRAAISFVRRPA